MKLIYLVTQDWYFFSHRLPMARAAIRAGFDVAVITNVDKHKFAIEEAGVRVIPFAFDRKSLNPITALLQISKLIEIYRAEKPDLVHHIALKPILFGSIAAMVARVPHVLNAFAGLGVIFHSNIFQARIIRPFLIPAFRFLLKCPGSWLLFQNKDDRAKMEALGLTTPERTVIIRGSGVDLDHYPVTPMPEQPPFICIFAGRMIDSKGLPTMQAAFEILEVHAPHIRLWMYGKPDSGNPGSWDQARIHGWDKNHPTVTWKGHREDMAEIWPLGHVAVLPAWGGEGLPKALLEAAACARPIIASDVSGCREVVEQGRNGLLVPPGDAEQLAAAILEMSLKPERCEAMGLESRKIVEGDLSAEAVSRNTEALYRRIVAA
jgi:glycosyltransferase involved in cell wall biosynthesis